MRVTFIHPDGRRETHSGQPGDTVMDVALDHRVEGILAQCGGGCTCATCHCFVSAPWLERLDPPQTTEDELLAYLHQRECGSRLSCQIFLEPALDGIEVRLPPHQE